MSIKFQITGCGLRIDPKAGGPITSANRERSAFSLVEVMVVVSLLSLIVLALMAVFSSTQRAFRAAVTQTDVLEGSRAAMELMASDLRAMTPSDGASNAAVNFVVTNNYNNRNILPLLVQSLPGTTRSRSNLLQEVFILNHLNNGWWGVGYAIKTNSSGNPNLPGNLYSLYRMQYPLPPGTNDPTFLFNSQVFRNFFVNPTNGGSHLLDGVVHFVVRAYDLNGVWLTNGYTAGQTNKLKTNAVSFYRLTSGGVRNGECGVLMSSNAVPAAVELQLGVLEDRTLQHAEALPTDTARTNYLWDKSGNVHLFRQRVTISNVDPTAYQ